MLPLFQAPLRDAAANTGSHACAFCRSDALPTLPVDGCDLIFVACPECEASVPFEPSMGQNCLCPTCKANVTCSVDRSQDNICTSCIAARRISYCHNTELGQVNYTSIVAGLAEGDLARVRRIMANERPTRTIAIEGGSMTTSTAAEHTAEEFFVANQLNVDLAAFLPLVFTPLYSSWQDPLWLICCRQPMVYRGCWSRQQFCDEAADRDGKKLFEAANVDPLPNLWESAVFDLDGVYAFRCSQCNGLRVWWDRT